MNCKPKESHHKLINKIVTQLNSVRGFGIEVTPINNWVSICF
jgi:hypothetical protein